jgi:hypothetical protein
MNKSTMILASLILGIAGYADPQVKRCQPSQSGIPKEVYPLGYNAPACMNVPGWNVDVWGSFCYWNVNQEIMDVVYVPINPSETLADVVNGSIVNIEDTWTPGFKVGLACTMETDGWVGSAEYTWVRSSTSVSGSNTTGNASLDYTISSLIPTFTVSGVTRFSSDWKMHLDQIDLLFSRPKYQGTRVAVSPFAGLRALWIRQRQTLNFTLDGISNPLTSKSQMWSIGPAAGISSHWLLGKGFRLEGSGAASLLYARYTDISFHFTELTNLPNQGKLTNVNAIRPTAECGIGIGWSSYLSNQNYLLDFSARYDFKYFWSQNMERWLTSTLGGYQGNEVGALMLHGLTLSSGIDF